MPATDVRSFTQFNLLLSQEIIRRREAINKCYEYEKAMRKIN